MSNHSFFAPSPSAFGALCQTSRSRQRAKSSRAAAVEPQLAPLCGRSLLASFPLFTHCLSNTAVFSFPSKAGTGASADCNLWNASHLDVRLGRSRIAIAPSDHGTQGHRLRANGFVTSLGGF